MHLQCSFSQNGKFDFFLGIEPQQAQNYAMWDIGVYLQKIY